MAEEHRCEASEGHRLCVNNCGFFGSPATMNLCAKCYTDIHLQEQHHASSKSSIEIALSSSSSSAASSSNSLTESLPPHPPPALTLPEVKLQLPPPADVAVKADVAAVAAAAAATAKSQPNRCLMCRKRVGLTGFKCRCGTTFCGVHRYPEKHACTFDFKAVGREEIARANPIIKAEKLRKI